MVVTVPTASLEGQVALITGAGRGIGRGCAIELGKRGASVIVNYVSSEGPAQEVVKIIEGFNNGAKAVAIKADVSKVSEITRLFEEGKKAFGKINIVMSNSGTESWDVTEEITEEKYDHVFNLNTRAQFFVGQTAYKYIEDNGRIILMSSIAAGLLGVKDHALYNASKMAVIGFIKAFATDFGKRGITVNGVAPGGIKSDMFTQNAWHDAEPLEKEALSWMTLQAAQKYALHAIRLKHDGFKLTCEDRQRLKDTFETLRLDGKITKDPSWAAQWLTARLMTYLSRAFRINAIRFGVIDWIVVVQKYLGLALQSALSCRAGDVTVSNACADKECLLYKNIQLQVLKDPKSSAEDPFLDRVTMQAKAALRYTKDYKHGGSHDHIVILDSVEDPGLNVVDLLKLLVAHALR
ncbi:hypothetical protein SLS61_001857 [Didymella pomorum]